MFARACLRLRPRQGAEHTRPFIPFFWPSLFRQMAGELKKNTLFSYNSQSGSNAGWRWISGCWSGRVGRENPQPQTLRLHPPRRIPLRLTSYFLNLLLGDHSGTVRPPLSVRRSGFLVKGGELRRSVVFG